MRKIAIVHDDLVQWGGAERMLSAISNLFPDAPIYTSVFDRDNRILKEKFGNKHVITSFVQNIPFWREMYKGLLPLYILAFEQFDFSGYDLVISQTTRFAKVIITKPNTKHICYCHTPPRFLWNFSNEVAGNMLFKSYISLLRFYDQVASRRVDYWLAGSRNAQMRIKKIYRSDSEVLYPFVDEKFFLHQSFDGGYFLIISRLNKYKKVDIAVKVFNKLGLNLKIVGKGPQKGYLKRIAKKNIEFIEGVSDDLLIDLIAGCKGLIVCAEEDFGLTPLEAQALGKGTVVYKKGGALETVIEDQTGVFFEEQSAESLERAIFRFLKMKITGDQCRANARRFNRESFEKQLLKMIELVD